MKHSTLMDTIYCFTQNFVLPICLLPFFLFSCAPNPNSSAISAKIDRSQAVIIPLQESNKYINQELNVEKFIKDIKYIPIQTKEKGILGEIDKVILSKDRIVLIDEAIAKRVLILDFSGKIIKNIRTIGRGPGEFLKPQDASFSTSGNKIALFARNLSKLIFYSSNGEFQDEVSFPEFYTNDIAWLEDDIFAFGNRNIKQEPGLCYNLMFYSLRSNFIGRFFPFDPEQGKGRIKYGSSSTFFKSSDKLLFSPIQNDTIFEVLSANQVKEKYIIDFGSNSLPPDFFNSPLSSKEYFGKLGNSNFAYNVNNFYESENWIFFNYLFQHRVIRVFYNKISKRVISGAEFSPLVLPLRLGTISAVSNDNFVSIIHPERVEIFRNLANSGSRAEIKKSFDQLPPIVKDLKSDDNPILAFIKFKEEQ